MGKCKWLPAVLVLIAGLAASSPAGARAGDKCLIRPNAPPPRGQHWYYHIDHASKRQCWYLRKEGLPVRRNAPQAKQQPLPPANPRPAPQASTQPPPAAQLQPASAAPAAPLPDSTVAKAPPPPWFDGVNIPKLAPAAWPSTPAAADASPSANSTDDPPPAHATVRPPPQAAAPPPAPAPIKPAAGTRPVFALFVLLFAGLAVAGLLFHIAERRRRAFEAASFRPPLWARVVALNAPAPRVGAPVPAARPEILQPRPAAPLVVPADHAERLAQALQELVDRLRAQPERAPGIVPDPTGHAPPRTEETAKRRAGRPARAEAFPPGATAAARPHRTARRSS